MHKGLAKAFRTFIRVVHMATTEVILKLCGPRSEVELRQVVGKR
jgi:hypothetical protein